MNNEFYKIKNKISNSLLSDSFHAKAHIINNSNFPLRLISSVLVVNFQIFPEIISFLDITHAKINSEA